MGIPLDMMTITIAAITIGIAVDNVFTIDLKKNLKKLKITVKLSIDAMTLLE